MLEKTSFGSSKQTESAFPLDLYIVTQVTTTKSSKTIHFKISFSQLFSGGLEELQELINEGMYFSVNAYAFKE